MRMGLILTLACLGGVAAAQDVPAATPSAAPAKPGLYLVTGQPYSAVRDYDRDQTRADGSRTKLHETTKYWRDSEGRTRTDMVRDRERWVYSWIVDPAAKVEYSWNNGTKVVTVHHFGEPNVARPATRPLEAGEVRNVNLTGANGQRQKGTASLLPPKTVDGLETTGAHTVAYADAARTVVVSTTDSWYQPELHMALLTDIVDQQYGHRHFAFHSLKREEPKADLFQLPKGYKLQEAETADTEQFE